ncbi:hypothetical protein V9T40_009633 [Parthenolecanium corni]|uniref:Proteasome activator complex subunit 3 n=1 Tax=Parthenolecanium corni TaxID=536013 RepID=A0AAN9Y8Z5_9HEMI
MADGAIIEVQQFKENIKMKGEDLIINVFPKKIVFLNELIKLPEWNEERMENLHEDINVPIPEPVILNNCTSPLAKKRKLEIEVDVNSTTGTKVFSFPSGMALSNKKLSKLINVIKPTIKQLVEDSNILKMWISFMIPKIEDGNNFGVSIQEDTLAEIQTVETEAAAFFDQISRYYVTRAKLVSKVAKYPHIEDYRKAVEELDEKQYLGLWLVLHEIRNHYSTLHDLVTKNLEKLKKPRNSNAESLY